MMFHSRFMVVTLMTLIVSACTTIYIPPTEDRDYFVSQEPHHRQMNRPRVMWVVLDNASEMCASLTGHAITATTRPMACAHWDIKKQLCYIITPPKYSPNYLGHELRHCFEGNFHEH